MTENDEIRNLLIAIAYKNDQSAYKEMFMRLHSQLKQFAYGILKSHEEAEELVSDLFITIWQKREKLPSIESPLIYFYSSVKNLAYNRLQKQKRQQNIKPEEWLLQVKSIYLNPEELMMTAEMLNKIQKAVNELPPRCKLIFKLVKEDGLKYREVAELLQLSIKTIEAQMAIALRRVGKCMHLELNASAHSGLAFKK